MYKPDGNENGGNRGNPVRPACGPAAIDGERNEPQQSIPNPTPTTKQHLLVLSSCTTPVALFAHVKTSNLAL